MPKTLKKAKKRSKTSKFFPTAAEPQVSAAAAAENLAYDLGIRTDCRIQLYLVRHVTLVWFGLVLYSRHGAGAQPLGGEGARRGARAGELSWLRRPWGSTYRFATIAGFPVLTFVFVLISA